MNSNGDPYEKRISLGLNSLPGSCGGKGVYKRVIFTHFYCYVSIGGTGAKNGNLGLLTELYF